MPGYPTELVSQIVTRLGTVLQVRPIRPDDAALLVNFHRHLSLRSVYRRFLYVHRSLSAAEVERFTRVDYVNRLALVAEDNSGLVAVARYDRTPGTTEAEAAFVVADQYQHHGVGTLLLEQLAAAAVAARDHHLCRHHVGGEPRDAACVCRLGVPGDDET